MLKDNEHFRTEVDLNEPGRLNIKGESRQLGGVLEFESYINLEEIFRAIPPQTPGLAEWETVFLRLAETCGRKK